MIVQSKEVKMPSGAILKIRVAPFAVSKKLYQALLVEIKNIHVNTDDMENLMKDLFCIGFSSIHVEDCLKECFAYCQYNDGRGDFKIDADTFEPIEARQDYIEACMEVARENVTPFMKSLFAQLKQSSPVSEKVRKSK